MYLTQLTLLSLPVASQSLMSKRFSDAAGQLDMAAKLRERVKEVKSQAATSSES